MSIGYEFIYIAALLMNLTNNGGING
jgi:hypothetical protein